MKTSWVVALTACCGLLGFAPLARADLILPGQMVSPITQQGTLGVPANVASVSPTPFSFDGVSGTYREFVFAGRTGNPLGGLSFEYQLTVAAGNPGVVEAFKASGFAGWQTNVTFAPGGTLIPTEADRSPGLGDVINFTLDGGVGAGVTSMWMIVDTNAPGVSGDTVQLISGTSFPNGPSVSGPAIGPAATPEPGTLPLALMSLLLGGAYVAYRRLTRSRPALA